MIIGDHDGLLWIDVETDGVDDGATLLEASMQSTDMYGNIMDDGVDVIIHHDTIRDDMDPAVMAMHGRNGLLHDVLHGGVGMTHAGSILGDYVMSAMSLFDVMYPAGASVGFDLTMLSRCVPGVIDGIGHKSVDLTTMNIMADHIMHSWYSRMNVRGTDHRSRHCLESEMERYRLYADTMRALDITS